MTGIRRNILIMADSRGRGLEPLLNQDSTNIKYKVAVLPGAQISRLSEVLTRKLHHETKPDLIIIFGGICSIMKITYNPTKTAILRYNTEDEIVQYFKKECDFSQTRVTHGLPLLLSPIVGMHLIAYAGSMDSRLYQMQPTLDGAVTRINRFIRETNELNGFPTPNTSSCIHRCRGKNRGYWTHYCKLYDGCHPTTEVLISWSETIKTCWFSFFCDKMNC